MRQDGELTLPDTVVSFRTCLSPACSSQQIFFALPIEGWYCCKKLVVVQYIPCIQKKTMDGQKTTN